MSMKSEEGCRDLAYIRFNLRRVGPMQDIVLNIALLVVTCYYRPILNNI